MFPAGVSDGAKKSVPLRVNKPFITRPSYLFLIFDDMSSFSGACHNCGKIGHRAADCWTKKPNHNEQSNQKQDRSIRCHNCNKVGHRARDCPNREGAFRFECPCGNEYSGLCEGMNGWAKCYKCGKERVRPAFRLGEDMRGPRNSANTHSCNRCNGNGNCPIASGHRLNF